MLDERTLSAHLARLGWTVEPHGPRTVRSIQQTDEGEITVYIRCTDNWLIASVVPFLSTRGDNPIELSRWLLRMNRDMFQSKFAYDEDGDVVLTVELPTESLGFEEVRATLESLRDYAVTYRSTLRHAAAREPQ